MKSFIFTTVIKNSTYCGTATVTIYRIVKNIPVLLGKISFNTGATKGAQSEVLTWLIKNGHLPKKLMKETKGYFTWNMQETHKISIKEV